jgi:hypothetical protein
MMRRLVFNLLFRLVMWLLDRAASVHEYADPRRAMLDVLAHRWSVPFDRSPWPPKTVAVRLKASVGNYQSSMAQAAAATRGFDQS